MNKKPLVISHADCMDGTASVWLINNILAGYCEILFMHYDEREVEFPKLDLDDRIVIIADFSIQPEVLLLQAHRIKHLLMLDHRASARDEWSERSYVIPDHLLVIM